MRKKDRSHYQTNLLRIWRESVQGNWRVTLIEVGTGDTRNFGDLSDMFVFLCAQHGRVVPQEQILRRKSEEKKEFQR
jgi:hypothetical protein